MKREFVMLAHKYDPKKHALPGMWWSEKLDGERCFWDGGQSRGLKKSDVPYANCLKDDRYKDVQYATGLWSRYGGVIHAPDWFLDQLPPMLLDGEMYSKEPTKRQFIHSTIKKIVPVDAEWQGIEYRVFDSPPPACIFADGIIDNTNFKKVFRGCQTFGAVNRIWSAKPETPFMTTYEMMKRYIKESDCIKIHPQMIFPFGPIAHAVLEQALANVVQQGGEGIMVRNPNGRYECGRSYNLLKVKPFDDAEGTVIGYTTGRETALGSKLLGRMGALILKTDSGVRLELSGFTDEERLLGFTEFMDLGHQTPYAWAVEHPEQEVPDWIEAIAFPRGSRVTFKYRGLSAEGIPQEARYWRDRNEL